MSKAKSIFLSYRRDDSKHIAGRIYDYLEQEFGNIIFKDVDSIPVGVDFREYINQEVSQCQMLLAIIGPHWLDATDREGRHRLQNPEDFVRLEIEAALQRNILVIPILVDKAEMPSATTLPTSLQDFAFRNSITVQEDPNFRRDMQRLISSIRPYFAHLKFSNASEKDKKNLPKKKFSQIFLIKPAYIIAVCVIGAITSLGFIFGFDLFPKAGNPEYEVAQKNLEKAKTAEQNYEYQKCIETAGHVPPYFSDLLAEAQETRGQCQLAQAIDYADQNRFKDAFALLDAISSNTAAASQSQKYLEQWSDVLLKRAEEKFQEGNTVIAIDMVGIVPSNSSFYAKAQGLRKRWEESKTAPITTTTGELPRIDPFKETFTNGGNSGKNSDSTSQSGTNTPNPRLTEARDELNNAQYALSQARGELETAQREYDRFRALSKEGAVSVLQLEESQNQVSAAESQVSSAEQRVEQARQEVQRLSD